MSNFINQQVRNCLNRYAVRDQTMIVGVSGGADSVALLLSLYDVRGDYGLKLMVANFDHGWRDTSKHDAEWVQQLAHRLGLEFHLGQPAEGTRRSEDSAREARYAFFRETVKVTNAPWLAVAHTANDQVETVLHHIARGTGLRGLMGIPECRSICPGTSVLRPLLHVSREAVMKDLTERQQAYCSDETNLSADYTRNRIRHDVLPFLRDKLNRRIDEAILRLAQQAAETQMAIQRIACEALDGAIVDVSLLPIRLKLDSLQPLPRAVVKEAMIELWTRQIWPRQGMTQQHWEQLADIILHGSPTGLSLPGRIQATRRGQILEIRTGGEPATD